MDKLFCVFSIYVHIYGSRLYGSLFAITLFVSARAVWIQPLIAKRFADARRNTAVWNRAALFQGMLLGDMLRSGRVRLREVRRQAALHVALLVLAALFVPATLPPSSLNLPS